MNFRKILKKIDPFILILIAIAIISHFEWFNLRSILFFHDWSFRNDVVTSQFLNFGDSAWISFTGFGNQNIQLYMFAPRLIWGLIGKYDLAVKITYLWPIAILSLLAPYYLVKKILSDRVIAFLGALMYGFSTYILMRSCAHLPIALVYSITPLVLLSLILFLEKPSYFRLIILSLLYSIGACYELRITYVVSLILLIYFLFFFEKEKLIRGIYKYLWLTLITFFLNLFWIIPTVLGDKGAILETANRGLWGDKYLDILKSMAFFDWQWSGSEYVLGFIKQPIPTYIWLVPIVSFLAFFQFRKESKNNKKYILFFGLILTLGIFLSKQSGNPFPNVYAWLYDNFPGFNIFRTASKFYLLIAIGYLGLFSFGLKFAFSKIKRNITVTIILAIFLLINAVPLVTMKIGALFVNRIEPTEYRELENKLQKDEDQFYRTLWVPLYSKWAYYENSRPKVSLWDELIKTDGIGKFSEINPGLNNFTNPELYSNIFKGKNGENILNSFSIKYVVIPKDIPESSGDRIFPYAGDRDSYAAEFDKVSYLEKEKIGGVDVYENKTYRPHIYLTNEKETIHQEISYEKVDFIQKNPTEYSVSIKNVLYPFYLNFSESFHPDWKLRAGKFNWFSVLTDKNYFLSDANHFKNDAGLNSFHIDPQKICQKEGACRQNASGGWDIDLTLYFRPQSYFYLGLIVSGATLISCLGYLGYEFMKRKKNEKIL